MSELQKSQTWAHLKGFANMLTEEQLSQPTRWWGEERGGTVSDMECLPENYIHDGESYSPESSYEKDLLDEMREDGDIDNIMPKGTPMIFVD